MGRTAKALPIFLSTHMEILDKVKELVSQLLEARQIELVDITYRRESGGMVLRLLVDKEGGITLDECTEVNEDVGRMLEDGSVMPDKYTLEVASPGLDRPLKTRRDFERVMGKIIRVHTYEPIFEKRRDCEGVVKYVDDQKVTVGDFEIKLKKIAKAKLKIEI